jgi:hypothetical protein
VKRLIREWKSSLGDRQQEIEEAAQQEAVKWLQTFEIYNSIDPSQRERLRVAVEKRIKEQDLVVREGNTEKAIVKMYQTGIERRKGLNQ